MINIANKLKNCPRGYKLYSPLFGEVTLDNIGETIGIITSLSYTRSFNIYGQYFTGYSDAECLLFPSKEQRDWSKFNYLEKGHRVMVSDDGINWSLKKYKENSKAYRLNDDENSSTVWAYIVPIEDFNLKAVSIQSNCNKSIV